MFQLLKPTLILICIIAVAAGALQLTDDLFNGKSDAYFFIGWMSVLAIISFYVEVVRPLRKAEREKAQQAAEESNIVTIDNEDCPEQDKDNPKL